MSYILDGTTIRNPISITEENDTQVAQNRTLSGAITRDYFGSNKRKWVLNFQNTKPTDYTAIYNIYASYLSTGTAKTFQSTEANYTIASVACHLDLQSRGFSVRGSSYLSDFQLILTEA